MWQDTTYEYDAAGNLTARERPNGMRDEFGYDEYGRLVRKAALRDGVLDGEAIITYENDLPATFFDSKRNVTELYSYDSADRVGTISYSSGESITFSYNLRSRVVEEEFTLPGGLTRTIGIEYDGANRQERITLDGTEIIAENLYENAQQVRAEYGNGLVREIHYEAAIAQLTGFTTTHPVDGIVEETTITRALATNPQHFRITTTTATPLATTTENYLLGLAGVLSDVNRRVGNRVWGWNDGEGESKTYVYDELSNLLTNATGDTFSYNPERNRLLSATLAHEGETLSYAYDEAGFATERNGSPIAWTATGNLASVGMISIDWDMVNRPISVSAGPLNRDFALFGGLVSSDPDTGAVGELDLGFVSIPFTGDERLYRHFDFRHNVSFVSDESGEIITHYRYSAYSLDAIWGLGADTRRFVGNHELGDGLVLAGLRVYDSLVGRFLSPDPILQNLNQFSYTLGDPVQFQDANGATQGCQGDVAEARVALAKAGGVVIAGVLASIVACSVKGPLGVVGAVGGAIATGIAISDFMDALDNYNKAKAACEGNLGTSPAEPAADGGGGATAPAADRSAASGLLGVGTRGPQGFGGGFTAIDYIGNVGISWPAGCEQSPGTLARANPRRLGYPLALLLCLQLVAAAFFLRRGV